MSAIAWDFPQPFVMPKVVEPSHLDEMQHTNNVVYLKWLEETAWEHSRQLGLAWEDYERLGHGMVARRHELDYLAPTFLGDALQLATWILSSDRLSIRRAYQFVRASDGVTVFRGRTQWVCVGIHDGKVHRMPPEFLEAYRSPLQIKES